MSCREISTDDAGRKVQALEWEIEQHKKLETTVAEVCLFLRSVMGKPSDGTDGDVKLDLGARNGFDFILSQVESLLYYADCGDFFDFQNPSCFYGSELKNPYKEAKA